MGTFGVLGLITLCMFFGIGGSFLHTFLIVLLGLSVFCLSVFFIFPYQAERVLTFLNPEEDVLGRSYQITQSLIALGSGGIFGVGFGNGIQKWSYLPQPMGNTIFAVWAEETGFIGALIIVVLYLIICWRGFIIAKKAPSKFSQTLAIGVTSWVGIQAFLHIMAVCALIPFTGIPLPFVSYGGSALIFNLIGIGILINVSRRTL
jgi:cell division protein FtsW